MKMLTRMFATIVGSISFLAPALARAHEVYVLTPEEIKNGLAEKPFAILPVIVFHFDQFIFWAFIACLTVCIVFFISILRPIERSLAPTFSRIRRFGAPIARVTIGISFILSAYYQATYGPELPLGATFAGYEGLITMVLIIVGIAITLGIKTRFFALIAFLLYTIAVLQHGMYMLTYTNYLGEIILLLILGSHHGTAPRASLAQESGVLQTVAKRFAPYSFLVLRIAFGISLLYASLYAKIFHNQLALMVAELPLAGHIYSLASVFGFAPDFLVIGAGIVEIVIALFFILGIEIRFTSIFLLFWLTLSLIYFGEVVWPHIILIGIPIAFIFYGYDKYSLEGRFLKKSDFEPVL